MGFMKRIATEFQSHPGKSLARFAPSERQAIRALTRSSEALLEYLAAEAAPKPTAGGVALSSIWLGSVYTGGKPERAGLYYVIDTVNESREVVRLTLIGNNWVIFRMGQAKEMPLLSYNKPAYHWFQMLDLSPDDMTFVRKELP